MATGQSAQPGRGMVLTDVTPGSDFRTGEADVWEAGTRLLKKYEEANKPNLIRRAQARGALEGAAVADGAPMPERGFMHFGDVAEARTAAMQTAYSARVRNDFDAREAEVRQQFRHDPEGYEAEMARVRSGFIQGAPPEFAVDVETYANDRAQRGLEAVTGARIARDDQEVVQATTVRAAKLQEDLIAMTARGDTESFQFMQAEAEYAALQDAREANPAILYSTEQRLADDEKLGDGMMLAVVNRQAIEIYSDSGRGLAGYAAAARHLEENLLNGEEFAGVAPGRLAKLHRDALTELRAHSVADREQARVEAEQERQRKQEMREIADSLVLDASLNGVTEAEILARDDIDDAAKTRILSADRARRSRERTEAAAIAALQAAGEREVYEGFKDQADAGTLSEAELADAVGSGLLTPGRAQNLRTRRDRVLGPQMAEMMGPVNDAARRPGASRRDRETATDRAEAEVAEWVRMHPNSTLAERHQQGAVIADRHFGSGRAGGAQNADQARAARIAAVNAQIRARAQAGRPYSVAEANRMRNEAQGR